MVKREHFHLPTFPEIFTRLAEATHFTNLDAKKVLWQILLDKESSYLTTMNTPSGRYWFLRLPYDIHSVEQIFYKRIGKSFTDINRVEVDIEDFLTWGKNNEQHNRSVVKCFYFKNLLKTLWSLFWGWGSSA